MAAVRARVAPKHANHPPKADTRPCHEVNPASDLWCPGGPGGYEILPLDLGALDTSPGALLTLSGVHLDLPPMVYYPINDTATSPYVDPDSLDYDRVYFRGTQTVPGTVHELYGLAGQANDAIMSLAQDGMSVTGWSAISDSIHLATGTNAITATGVNYFYATSGFQNLTLNNAQPTTITVNFTGTSSSQLHLHDGANSLVYLDHVGNCYGGSGADTMIVTAGPTTMYGQGGADVFGSKGSGVACVQDFSAAEDKLGFHTVSGGISFASTAGWDGHSAIAVGVATNVELIAGSEATAGAVEAAVQAKTGELYLVFQNILDHTISVYHTLTADNTASWAIVAQLGNFSSQAQLNTLGAVNFTEIA